MPEPTDEKKEESSLERSKSDFTAIIFTIIHCGFFLFYIPSSIQSVVYTVIESIFFFILFGATLFFFILKNPYYFYYYLGCYGCSFMISPYLPIVLIILLPEFLFLFIISKGELVGELSIFHGTYLSQGIRMDQATNTWRASGSSDEKDKEDKNKSFYEKRYFMWIMGLFTLTCVIIFYGFAFQTFHLNFPLEYNPGSI